MGRALTILFVVLLLSSLFVLAVTPVNVQAVSKLSVPQFSAKIITVDHEFDGYTYKVKQIEVTIKNQPFTSSSNTDTRGGAINDINYVAPDKTSLYYQVQYKDHSDKDWPGYIFAIAQSVSSPTIGISSIDTEDSQMDVRVRAVDGYYRRFGNPYGSPMGQELVAKAESDWSHPQTINTNNRYSTSSSQTKTPQTNSPTIPDNNPQYLFNQTQLPSFAFPPTVLLWIGTFLFVGVVVAVVMVFLRHHLKTLTYPDSTTTNNLPAISFV